VLVWFVSNPGNDYLELLVAVAGTIVVLVAALVAGVKGVIGRGATVFVCSVVLALLSGGGRDLRPRPEPCESPLPDPNHAESVRPRQSRCHAGST